MARQSLKNLMKLVDISLDEDNVAEDFLTSLKKSIELESDKNQRKPSQTYKPSSLKCIRNMYYQVTGEEQDIGKSSYVLVGICNSGSDIHERIQDSVLHMKDNGFDCEYLDVAEFVKENNLQDIEIVSKQGYETKLYHNTLNMSFLTDGIIRYKDKYYITEFKTETSRKWQTRTDVDEKHHAQAIAYSQAFGIEDVIFVYINRDILDMKAFLFHVTQEMRDGLIKQIRKCDEYVHKGVVPPITERTTKLCQYCAYLSKCERDG